MGMAGCRLIKKTKNNETNPANQPKISQIGIFKPSPTSNKPILLKLEKKPDILTQTIKPNPIPLNNQSEPPKTQENTQQSCTTKISENSQQQDNKHTAENKILLPEKRPLPSQQNTEDLLQQLTKRSYPDKTNYEQIIVLVQPQSETQISPLKDANTAPEISPAQPGFLVSKITNDSPMWSSSLLKKKNWKINPAEITLAKFGYAAPTSDKTKIRSKSAAKQL